MTTVAGALTVSWCCYALAFLSLLGKTGKVNHFVSDKELDWLLHTHLEEWRKERDYLENGTR